MTTTGYDDGVHSLKVIDSLGAPAEVLKTLPIKIGPAEDTKGHRGLYPFVNAIQVFNYQKSGNRAVGFINFKTKRYTLTDQLYIGAFDPVSGLALATDSKKTGDRYINQNGAVVIEMAERSQW